MADKKRASTPRTVTFEPSAGWLLLGMHRSGTSALSRVLALCGADIGARILGASAGNDAGHWEDAIAVEIHERLLARLGLTWDGAFALPADWQQHEAASEARDAIARYVAEDRARHALWVAKDPRISLFAPLWQDVAAEAGHPLASVLLLRHPEEVAGSLQARDGLSRGRSLALWLEYTLAAAQSAAKGPHLVATYDDVLGDWRSLVARLGELPGGQHLDPKNADLEISAFLDAGRRHHRETLSAGLPVLVREVWEGMRAAVSTGTLDAPLLGDWVRALQPARELAQGVLSDWQQRERQLWQRVASAEGALVAGTSSLASVPADVGELRQRVDLHHVAVVSAITQDIQRMQVQLGEAVGAASAREAEAGLARELSPRLAETTQRLDVRLAELSGLIAPMASAVPAELQALTAGVAQNREALVSAITQDIQRMQVQLGEALGAASAREAEAGLARELSPKLQALAEGVAQNREALVSAITQDIQRMQVQLGEALGAASARDAEAGLARELSPKLQALSEGVAQNREALVSAITQDIRRMQVQLGEALGAASAREAEAALARELSPKLQALAEGVAQNREALVSAITQDIRRMQVQLGEALGAASAREAEAAIARSLSPRVGELVDAVDQTGRMVKDIMDKEISAMKDLIAEAGKSQGVAEAQARAAETRAASAEVQVAAVLEERSRLQSTVEDLLAAVAKLEIDFARLQEERASMVGRLLSLEFEARRLADIERQFDQLRTSRSWRWTRPLRVAARLVSGRWTPSDSEKWTSWVNGWRGGNVAPTNVVLAPVLPAPTVTIDEISHESEAAPSALVVAAAQAVHGLPDVFVWSVIDWHFRFQRPQHLAKALAAKGHRVFYISNNFVDADEAGFRADPLDDSGRLFQVHLNLRGAPPIYFALPSEAQSNQLSGSLAELLAWTCTQSSLSLVQHPYWVGLVRTVPNARVVYDCMDHHGGFENNAPVIVEAEDRLCRDADLVIVTSDWLQDEISTKARATAMVRNAGEFDFFRDAPARVFRDPKGRKVIGYYGAIAEWFDLDLVRAVAMAHPDCLVLMVGNDTAGAGPALADLANVEFTGEVPYVDLPFWLHGFDVCLLPFKVIPLTLATNPVKVYEYLAAGKPVVAVQLPEMAQFGDLVATAVDVDGFVAAVSSVLGGEPASKADARRAFAAEQTWTHRAEALDAAIEALEEPRVSVIVLTYNNLAFTEACLFSLEAYSDYRNLEVLIVDNASTDGSREWLQRWAATPSEAGHARRLILNDANLGFSAGNNVGLRAATGDYLVILNNDTYVTPGWVRTLVAHLRADANLGLMGPVTNNIGNEAKIEIAYPDMVEMIREAGRYTRRHPGHRYPMRNAAFFCVAMTRSTFERVGEMDEAFGVGFFEDDDYCRRVEQAGLSIACADDVFVHHHLSASFDALKAGQKQALFERNKAIYEAKWGEWQPHAYRQGAAK